ncbi:hypothetical protein U27_01187 [Candidatus Vecturithrix granuli]|uniref:DUF1343 domain-containing protein n=1 Tax=Vecturithrix granuli TaxID=1499967 RepID=A0A081C9N2_VECG1|nr:hypothetical protein U27_01187 [Candidatus Vecturithrix granuli]
MKLGIDTLLENREMRRQLAGRRVALLGHPASVTKNCCHSLDALMECPEIRVASAFGPQHGMRGDKQDNMIESEDYMDPRHHIPVFSLYGEVRYPTDTMMATFDVLLIDLQDIGTRIYTYVTTLAYMLEACARHQKSLWVLDRPNPAGRPIEGTILEEGWESFIGVGPLIMRHGMTLGELARWFVAVKHLDLDVQIIPMTDYQPDAAPGYGWPLHELPWVNPSPNASSLNMARCFSGTVLFEGTTLSEGRGTTTSLEVIGAPDLDFDVVLKRMETLQPQWLKGCFIRRCAFEPTFQKHAGKLCAGIQIHTDHHAYRHEQFQPYRLAAMLLKSIRLEYPEYPIWHTLPYEYETEKLAIDLLSGGTFLREWVDDAASEPADFDVRLRRDEQAWAQLRQPYVLY